MESAVFKLGKPDKVISGRIVCYTCEKVLVKNEWKHVWKKQIDGTYSYVQLCDRCAILEKLSDD
jgi:hypothetical protein